MASVKHPNEPREPAEIERDIEETRLAIDTTVGELGQRLAPRQLVDEARTYVKETAVRGMNSMWTRMSDNAVPLGLIGGGMLWMLASRRGRHDGAAYAYDEGYEGEGAWEERRWQGGESSSARERLAQTGERAREMGSQLRERGHEWRERGADLGHRARERARERMDQARHGLHTMRSDQPLLLALACVAAGALIGSMIPSTRREDAMLGEQRDRLVDAGAEKVEQVREAAASKARELGEQAREKAAEVRQAQEPEPPSASPSGI